MSIVDITYNLSNCPVIEDEDIVALFLSKGYALAAREDNADGTIKMKFWNPDVINVRKRKIDYANNHPKKKMK